MTNRTLLYGLRAAIGILFASLSLDLGLAQDEMSRINRQMPPPLKLDRGRIEGHGIAWMESDHLRLLTDIRDEKVTRELMQVFDLAVDGWCERFSISHPKAKSWRLSCICMRSPESLARFRDAGLIPDDLPPFPAGFNRGHEIWMYFQPGNYYTRHLLIHEGTHGFMQWFLKGSGPPWFSEGMAEMLAVHRWQNGQLQLGLTSASKAETEYWGRPDIIKRYVKQGERRTLKEVISIPNQAFRNVDNYGWAWAACRFLDQHPQSHDAFQNMTNSLTKSDSKFNASLIRKLKTEWKQLELEWDLYTREMDYGYAISDAVVSPANSISQGFEISPGKGWQTTLNVVKGETLEIETRGKFVIHKNGSETWESESNGITLVYHDGKPLGVLEMAILEEGATQFPESQTVSSGGKWKMPATGKLMFRVNDHPGARGDNQGSIKIQIRR